ncbi:antioxidant, AhpC/TSA family protein [Gregarina niphandrodes]|uniref:Antioxidant, AhpC/TSA family protein n=1 Tax=Gregarina niphandrodes TaxID=110365 RepID=A0A023B389_GRENI|nr:antioxidant, AhpC/TSA family protein [Gregarina niphandrodes]EZG55368.1 antioxidant, AhpC/TSA family protein [Gregarina niphandrodes]|eukprot:XP_011131615.1 antioxidant, AhpC/TSA family protein [Gregarina niphandrodes]
MFRTAVVSTDDEHQKIPLSQIVQTRHCSFALLLVTIKAKSPGCTKQLREANEQFDRLVQLDCCPVGVCVASQNAIEEWHKEMGLSFPIVQASPELLQGLGVFEKCKPVRSWLLLDGEGGCVTKRRITSVRSSYLGEVVECLEKELGGDGKDVGPEANTPMKRSRREAGSKDSTVAPPTSPPSPPRNLQKPADENRPILKRTRKQATKATEDERVAKALSTSEVEDSPAPKGRRKSLSKTVDKAADKTVEEADTEKKPARRVIATNSSANASVAPSAVDAPSTKAGPIKAARDEAMATEEQQSETEAPTEQTAGKTRTKPNGRASRSQSVTPKAKAKAAAARGGSTKSQEPAGRDGKRAAPAAPAAKRSNAPPADEKKATRKVGAPKPAKAVKKAPAKKKDR